MADKLSARYPHVRRFLDEATSASGRIHPTYIRNFRELVKLLPLIGSWLDANTLGAIQDRALDERLQSLERASAKAIDSQERSTQGLEDLVEVNAHLYLLIAAYQDSIFRTNTDILSTLRTYLPIPPGASTPFKPHEGFCLVIFSGASATGKDVLVDRLLSSSFRAHPHTEALTKLTTRRKRHSDSRYYRFLANKQFSAGVEKGDILFPYYKRRHQYGFDKSHLFRAAATPALMLMIFTEFSMLPTAQLYLREQGVRVVSILLQAPFDHLVHRSWFRSFPEREVRQRIDSIQEDVQFLERHPDLVKNTFSHVVYNGDDRSKQDTLDELLGIIAENPSSARPVPLERN